MMNNTTNEILGKVTVSTDDRERIFRTNIRNLDIRDREKLFDRINRVYSGNVCALRLYDLLYTDDIEAFIEGVLDLNVMLPLEGKECDSLVNEYWDIYSNLDLNAAYIYRLTYDKSGTPYLKLAYDDMDEIRKHMGHNGEIPKRLEWCRD